MLTTLQLILSMTQKLGPSIMKKVTQIIGLANNILEHQGIVVSNGEGEKAEGMDGDDADEADVEILSLVLTLLSAILTGTLEDHLCRSVGFEGYTKAFFTNHTLYFYMRINSRKRVSVAARPTLAGINSGSSESTGRSPFNRDPTNCSRPTDADSYATE